MKPRKHGEYLTWEEYFMGIALISAKRSKDPHTQVGACIVNKNKKIVGIGYNGFPIGCPDNNLPWDKQGEYYHTKYAYIVHAEANAILNSTKNLNGCTLYVCLFPCNECAKLIIQSKIKKVIYLDDKYANTHSVKAAKRMFEMTGVKYKKFKARKKGIKLEF